MRSQDIPWAARVRVLAVWALGVVLATLILAAPLALGSQVRLQEGDVARSNVVAPRQVTYVSEILTGQRRESAANAVPDVYDPPQARVGRQQLTLANQLLDFIVTIRSDPQIDTPTKIAHLNAVSQLDLPPAVVGRLLALSSTGWERTAAEVQVVLERAMREEIRETNLADEKRKVAARVRLDLPEEEAAVVSEIVQDLLIPNSFYNAGRTEERRRLAGEGVEPVSATVERNETILREGDIVTPMDIEALDALGLRQMGWSLGDFRAALALVLLLALVYLYYFWRQEPRLWLDLSVSLIITISALIFVVIAKVVIPTHALMPYLVPFAALTMLLSVTIRFRLALVITGLFTILVGWLSAGDVELMAYALLPGLVGALKLRRGERLSSFAWAAFYAAVTCVLVVLAFRVGSGDWDVRGLAELVGAGLFNGLLSMTVTLLGAYLIGALFGVTTSLQLMELSRPTHPLLRHLLLKAPGTYHHTLIVANMAERAAEAIGADALLTRVGSYYHDVGKTIRPYFFIENRSDPIDPHASLDPYTSAQVIIAHVKDGLDLARKYRLPKRVAAFIPEHHGTQLASYFYHQAVKQAASADAVDRTLFQYPGPSPQSRETAITMLADGAEATVRSKRPATVEELEKVVADSIQSRLTNGQLDACSISVEDLRAVQRAFVDVLRGLQHPRVDYPPELHPGQSPALFSASAPAVASPAAVAPAPTAGVGEEHAEPAVSNPGSGATSVF